MSFKKGEYYRCIQGTSSFNVGSAYLCTDVNTSGVWCEFSDMHSYRMRFTSPDLYFDSSPVSQVAASPVAAHAAYQQQQAVASLAPKASAKPGSAPSCCGQSSEKKVFASFEYFYCNKCKKEVGGKAEPAKLTNKMIMTAESFTGALQSLYGLPAVAPSNNMQQKVLPPGVAALKGDQVACANCGAVHGILQDDMPNPGPPDRDNHIDWIAFTVTGDDCCQHEYESRVHRFLGYEEFFVKGRGWV